MITQLEFDQLMAAVARSETPPRLPKVKTGLNTQTYALGLAKALRVENLAHGTFNVLTAIAREQARHGHATTTRIALALGVSFNAIHLHLHKSPHYFRKVIDPERKCGVLNRLQLSEEAITLLVTIQRKAARYAEQYA